MHIRRAVLLATAVGLALFASRGLSPSAPPAFEEFNVATLTRDLDTPWDLAWGPDSMIWVSERGGRISRVDPTTGVRTTAGLVKDAYESGEGGLMGIAFHPDFPRVPVLYAMHTYSGTGTHNKLVRLRWSGRFLGPAETLFDGIPGGGIHNGSRIVVGPDRMLYISTGDAGYSDTAQDTTSLGGKILRLDLDGKPAPGNPFHNAVWSYGHRNPQGLVFHPTTGVLYETEHGPSDNDEVNIIQRGRNYGWPTVHGMCDENVERVFCQQHNVVEPLTTWTPTVAISGSDLYLGSQIAQFRGTLLATSLAGSSLWRMVLSADGKAITQRERLLSGTYGRLRDVLVAPNGDVFVCTSNHDGRGSPHDGDDRIMKLTRR